ncbi:MAG: class I SAM-dependent methyltransferase [Desulfobacterales bacterium]|jgi:D-alanine-D-alanine ligase
MSITVNPDWWKTLFDEIYLLTDARSVCDPDITRREVDVICSLLPIQGSHKILDLCGGHGRHSFELSRRGFKACTLFDYSQTLIDIARAKANDDNATVDFICGDAREIDLSADTYDHVIIMGNSLGYIQEEGADAKILAEAYRVLHAGGWILVDVADGKVIKSLFKPNAWHEIGEETIVCRQREIQGEVICAREIVLSKARGLIRDQAYAIRFYEASGLSALLEQAKFKNVHIHTDFSPHQKDGDYGFMNSRMVATAQKT